MTKTIKERRKITEYNVSDSELWDSISRPNLRICGAGGGAGERQKQENLPNETIAEMSQIQRKRIRHSNTRPSEPR